MQSLFNPYILSDTKRSSYTDDKPSIFSFINFLVDDYEENKLKGI